MKSYRDMPGPGEDEKIEALCEEHSARDLAAMFLAATLESDVLRARLRKAEAGGAPRP